MKRVLFISSQPFFEWRGSPIRVAYDVQALAELGYEVDLLTLPVGEERRVPGVNVVRAPNLFRVGNVPIGPSPVKAAFDGVLLFQAIGRTLRRRYSVVHGVEDAGIVALTTARLSGCRCVFEKHSDPASYGGKPLREMVLKAYAAVERYTIRHADAVIGTGPGLVEQARGAGARRATHIFDIPSSLTEATPEGTARARARLAESDDEILAAYVGSFAVYQGVDLLMESIPLVARACPRVRFIIIGGSEQEIADRRALLRERNADHAVRFIGKLHPDELPDYLRACDILLSPRLSGVNTPLKLLDYLKAGRAIAATTTQSNRLLLDEQRCVMGEPAPERYAAAICRLADDENLRAALAGKARELVDTTYNFGEFKRRLGACYEELDARDCG